MKKHVLIVMLALIFTAITAFAWGQSAFYEESFQTNQGWILGPNWMIYPGTLLLNANPAIFNFDISASSPDIMVPLNAGDMVVNQYLNVSGYVGNPPETFEIIALVGGVSHVLWSYSSEDN
ncbi:MAG: hypothetical protein PHR32_09005 [Candidatus Cloacimonetes bacterium]|jgi:hypothetical protein|nr:hypothetical protein [Candidatus Cloacimonadota bacterium]